VCQIAILCVLFHLDKLIEGEKCLNEWIRVQSPARRWSDVDKFATGRPDDGMSEEVHERGMGAVVKYEPSSHGHMVGMSLAECYDIVVTVVRVRCPIGGLHANDSDLDTRR